MELISVLLWENTRKQIREAIDNGLIKGAIIPTGSTEQHNEHLAMIHDTASALHIAEKVALKLYPKVIVTTPLAIGISEHWMEHKGTLSLRPEVFCEVLYDVCDSLRRHGIKSVLVVNGHAGNIGAVRQRLEDFRNRLGIKLDFCSYWDAYPKELVKEHMESGVCPGHAAEFETSFALAAFPKNVHMQGVDYSRAKLTISDPRRAEDDRKYHEQAKLSTPQKGEAMINYAVEWVTEKMKAML
jgi:creatinine amidohydrolase